MTQARPLVEMVTVVFACGETAEVSKRFAEDFAQEIRSMSKQAFRQMQQPKPEIRERVSGY